MSNGNNDGGFGTDFKNLFAQSVAQSRDAAKKKRKKSSGRPDQVGDFMENVDTAKGFGSAFSQNVKNYAIGKLIGLFGG